MNLTLNLGKSNWSLIHHNGLINTNYGAPTSNKRYHSGLPCTGRMCECVCVCMCVCLHTCILSTLHHFAPSVMCQEHAHSLLGVDDNKCTNVYTHAWKWMREGAAFPINDMASVISRLLGAILDLKLFFNESHVVNWSSAGNGLFQIVGEV